MLDAIGVAGEMTGRRYRVGPWPGLTPLGAGVLLVGALLLAVVQLALGSPRQPMPDVPLMAVLSLVPLAVASRIVRAPGAASAVCGAYLLPRSLLSLLDPSLEPPPLLLVPALAFDVCAWLTTADLASLGQVWPRTRSAWASRPRPARTRGRRIGAVRALAAGAAFGCACGLVEPPLKLLLGADVGAWSGAPVWLATLAATVGCALVGLSARDTGS